jgi:hypothetical protein
MKSPTALTAGFVGYERGKKSLDLAIYGFKTAKDVLGVIVIPISIFILGLAWPWWQRYRRKLNFYQLLRHELHEMKPIDGTDFTKWSD